MTMKKFLANEHLLATIGGVLGLLAAWVGIRFFGMGLASASCVVLAILSLFAAVFVYFKEQEKGAESPTPPRGRQSEPPAASPPMCPYCLSHSTLLNEDGTANCLVCNAFFQVEDPE